jgi:undecaprenyl-diphosphatase
MKLARIFLVVALAGTVIIHLFPRTWELDMIAALQQNRTDFSDSFFQLISNSAIKSSITVGIPLILILFSFLRPNKLLRARALLILLSLAVGGLFSYGLKKVVREPRPYEVDTRICQLGEGGGYGFPSGHTIEVVAFGTALAVFWPEAIIIIPAILLIVMMMFSRIYLGVHDPGDIVGGMFLGILSFLLVMKARDFLFPNKAKIPSP